MGREVDGVAVDPIKIFGDWFNRARENSGCKFPDAMCLTTSGDGRIPEGRIVLLKKYDEKGFVFYTDYRSLKGRSLARSPRACLTFFWDSLDKQIIISGSVSRVAPEESDEYFRSRPRMHRLAAWASRQGEEMRSAALLTARFVYYGLRFAFRNVPRPDYWGGYRLVPDRFEFMEGIGGSARSVVFVRDQAGWIRRGEEV